VEVLQVLPSPAPVKKKEPPKEVPLWKQWLKSQLDEGRNYSRQPMKFPVPDNPVYSTICACCGNIWIDQKGRFKQKVSPDGIKTAKLLPFTEAAAAWLALGRKDRPLGGGINLGYMLLDQHGIYFGEGLQAEELLKLSGLPEGSPSFELEADGLPYSFAWKDA
jgi:hypothetical protein